MSVYADAGGTPGGLVVSGLTTVFAQRSLFRLGAESIYRYIIDLPPTELPSGGYWLSIVSDGISGSGSDPPPNEPSFNWQQGQLDSTSGVPDAATIGNAMPVWQAFEGEFAVELCGPVSSPAIPTLDRWGASLMSSIIMLVAWPMIRRRRFRSRMERRSAALR